MHFLSFSASEIEWQHENVSRGHTETAFTILKDGSRKSTVLELERILEKLFLLFCFLDYDLSWQRGENDTRLNKQVRRRAKKN